MSPTTLPTWSRPDGDPRAQRRAGAGDGRSRLHRLPSRGGPARTGRGGRVLDDFSTGRRENLGAGVDIVEGDIRDMEICRAACRGVAYVFHEAALGSVPR